MCIHILNAQVAVRAQCCKKWFDCPQCHEDLQPDHPLLKTTELVLACKQCKKVFRKDLSTPQELDDADEYCPHCDNHYVIDARVPEAVAGLEADDPRMNGKLLKDQRVKRVVDYD